MKKILLLLFLNLLIANKINYAQCNPKTLITQLNSESIIDRLDAVRDLIICGNSIEAISALEKRFQIEENSSVKTELLRALDHFCYENIVSISHQFINEADNYDHYTLKNKLTNKLYAVSIQFKYSDYTNADIVFEYLSISNDVSDASVEALNDIIENLPAYEQQAKDALINIARNADHFAPRSIAIDILSEHFGLDIANLIIERFTTDEEYVPRYTALKNLFKLNHPTLHSLLVERILVNVDEFGPLRYRIADSLLGHWGEPWDLRDVIEYSKNESEQVYQNLINYEIRDFIPPKPDESYTINQMFDNLQLYIETLNNYEWIIPNASYDFLSRADEIYNFFKQQDYVNAIEHINTFLADVEQALASEEITIEGYKFLYYYPSYIKLRIEEL